MDVVLGIVEYELVGVIARFGVGAISGLEAIDVVSGRLEGFGLASWDFHGLLVIVEACKAVLDRIPHSDATMITRLLVEEIDVVLLHGAADHASE